MAERKTETETIRLLDASVQDAEDEPGKFEVLCEMHSSWAGRYWDPAGPFNTKEEAEKHKNKLVVGLLGQ